MTPLVALTATALIMGGTGHPLSTPQDSPEFINSYTNDANNDYIVLTGFCGADSCTPTAVSTPGAVPARVGNDALRPIGRARSLQPQSGDQCATGRRFDRRLRILAERPNRIDPEGQPRRGGLDAAVVVCVDRKPEPTQRRHPGTIRGPRDPHSRSHFRRRGTHQHRLQDLRHHPRSTTAGPTSRPTRSIRSPPRMRWRGSTICTGTTRASVSETRCIRGHTETPITT